EASVFRPQRQRPDAAELARLGPRLAPALDEAEAGVELADAVVLAELGDVVIAVVVLDHVTDVAELAWPAAGLAAEDAQLLALGVGRVDADAVVVRIAEEEVAVAVDAEAAGPAVAVVGRVPSLAEVLAVAVVDLNAG